MYVKDSWLCRASSQRAFPALAATDDEEVYETNKSYAVGDEPPVPAPRCFDEHDAGAHLASPFNGLDVQAILNRRMRLVRKNIALKLDLTVRDARIAKLEEEFPLFL